MLLPIGSNPNSSNSNLDTARFVNYEGWTTNIWRHQGHHYTKFRGSTSQPLCKCGYHHNCWWISKWRLITTNRNAPNSYADASWHPHYLCNVSGSEGSSPYHNPKVFSHLWPCRLKNHLLWNQCRWGSLKDRHKFTVFRQLRKVHTH